jgi:Flp pilus assembly pilin Flp
MKKMVQSFWSDESGQGLTEYGFLVAFIALAVIALLLIFGDELRRIYNAIITGLQSAPDNINTGT